MVKSAARFLSNPGEHYIKWPSSRTQNTLADSIMSSQIPTLSTQFKPTLVGDRGFILSLLEIGEAEGSTNKVYKLLIMKNNLDETEDPGSWWENCPPETQALHIRNCYDTNPSVTEFPRGLGPATFKHCSENYPRSESTYEMAVRSGIVGFSNLAKEQAATSSLLSRRQLFFKSVKRH